MTEITEINRKLQKTRQEKNEGVKKKRRPLYYQKNIMISLVIHTIHPHHFGSDKTDKLGETRHKGR